MRLPGYEAADKTVRLSFPAAAARAVRLRILPIRLLRWHGIEIADKTVSAALPVGAIFVGSTGNNVGATIARPHGRKYRLFEMPKRQGSVIAKILPSP